MKNKKIVLNLEGSKYFNPALIGSNLNVISIGVFLDKKKHCYFLTENEGTWSITFFTSNMKLLNKFNLVKGYFTDIPHLTKIIQNYKKYLL